MKHYRSTTGLALPTLAFPALTGPATAEGTPTGTPGVLSIVKVTTLTGGTGRFAGATGGFVIERLDDIGGGTTIGNFDGTISPPGSRNR